ncbi:MAG TPA: TIGR03435 family protein [Terracidiphilus sp.]|nr:TIGR03435 family protein [Terracidiphilus sp.]
MDWLRSAGPGICMRRRATIRAGKCEEICTALCAGLIAASLLTPSGFAQTPTVAQSPSPAAHSAAQAPQATQPGGGSAALPQFEVVSIKPDKSGSMMMRIQFTPDGISVNGLTVHMLLREALGLSDNQIAGEPGWLNSARFNVDAKIAADDVAKFKDLKPAERWAMMLPVFEDRFGLKFHHETKEITQYVLVVAKGGLKMKEAAPGETYANGIKTQSGAAGGAGMMRMGPGELTGQAVPIENLLRFLSFQFHSPVLDKTGLTGKYDMNLTWAPDESEGMMRPPDGGAGAGNPAPPASTGPSIFTALEEQLGLKLEAHKEPGDVIVIDHIEQPSAN